MITLKLVNSIALITTAMFCVGKGRLAHWHAERLGKHCSQTYTVQSGDNCYVIAKRYGLNLDAFMQANGISAGCSSLQVIFC